MTPFSRFFDELKRIDQLALSCCTNWDRWNAGYRNAFSDELSRFGSGKRKLLWVALTQRRGTRFKREVHDFVWRRWEEMGIVPPHDPARNETDPAAGEEDPGRRA